VKIPNLDQILDEIGAYRWMKNDILDIIFVRSLFIMLRNNAALIYHTELLIHTWSSYILDILSHGFLLGDRRPGLKYGVPRKIWEVCQPYPRLMLFCLYCAFRVVNVDSTVVGG